MRTPVVVALLGATLLACHRSTPAPRTGTVTVVVDGPEAATAVVAFHRPDGSVQEVLPVDAAHMASAVVADGSLVTVGRQITRSGVSWSDLVTIAAVEPGDVLVVGSWAALGDFSATVRLPGPLDGVSRYVVDASCAGAFADAGYVDSFSLLLTGCTPTTDFLALARGPDGAFAAYASAVDVWVGAPDVIDPRTVTLGPWRTDFGALAVDVTNAPEGSRDVNAFLDPRHAGRLFWRGGTGAWSVLPPGGSASLGLRYPQAFATSGRLEVDVGFGESSDAPDAGTGWVIQSDLPLAPRTIDLSTAIPPRLSGASLSTAGGALVASWRQAGADPALDGVILGTSWRSGVGEHDWTVVLPPGTTSFAFPALPPELAAMAPGEGAGPTSFSVGAYDVAELHGYAEFRPWRAGLLDAPGPVLELPGVSALRGTWTRTP